MGGGWSPSASPSASRPGWFALRWLCGDIAEQRCTGSGIGRAPLQSQEVGWWRLPAPACLRAFPPVCSGPGMLQGEGRGDKPPSGLSQECVMGACVQGPAGPQRIGPSCKTSPGSEGGQVLDAGTQGLPRPRSAEGPSFCRLSPKAAVPFMAWWWLVGSPALVPVEVREEGCREDSSGAGRAALRKPVGFLFLFIFSLEQS